MGATEHEAVMANSVGLALLVVLETLTPAEPIAFVLHDLFAVPFEEIAPIVGRSTTARGNLRVAHAVECRRNLRLPAVIKRASARLWMPFSRLRAMGTSRHCSRCSTKMSCCRATGHR